jgi:CRP/FNR family transcriptional regulator, cyclic AMP receptor protein
VLNNLVPGKTEGRIPAELAGLDRSAVKRRFAENELVLDFEDGSTDVYFIMSGAVRVLIRTPNGKEMLLADLGAGEFFGETTAIDGGARSANVTAIANSELLIIPCGVFRTAVHSTPAVCDRVLRLLTNRIRDLNERMFQRNVLDVRHRLYADLIRLSRPRGGHGDQRILSPPPPHHDLAARIGCRREQVSREITAMEAEGLAEKTRGGLVILRPAEMNRRIAVATDESRLAGDARM